MSEKRKDSKGRILQKGESQRKDGRYVYQYIDQYGKRRSMYAWDLAELRDKEKQIVIDTYEGIDTGKADKITTDMLFDRYLESKKNLRETTLTGYKFSYDKYVRDRIGSMPITSVKYSTILDLYNTLLDGVISFGSLTIVDNVLHPMFEMAIRDDMIRKNPTQDVIKKIRDTHDIENTDRYALTAEETEAFINYAKKQERYSAYMPIITFLFGTGCRIGEALGLTWDDVDFKNGIININHTLTYKSMRDKKTISVINPPKSKAGSRIIPMFEGVRGALLTQMKMDMLLGRSKEEIEGEIRYKGGKKEKKTCKDFVFINSQRTVYKATCINRAINELLTKYEIDELKKARKENREPFTIRHFSVHNCRHTFCTRLCEKETNLILIRDIMGHSDISITSKVYAECTEATKKNAFENLESSFQMFEGLFKIG